MEKAIAISNMRPLTRNALRHDVVVHLMAAIFQGTLPAGSRLIIRQLAEQMGISATPIREALVELEAIGVVQFIHNRGAVSNPFGRQQLRDILHVRRILEAEAARCACGQIDSERLKSLRHDMQQLLEEGESDDWLQMALATDQQLHDLIATNCGNERLAGEIRRYHTLMQAIREIVGNRRQAQKLALEEHVPIIEALLARNGNKAAAAISHHIESARKSIDAVLFRED